MHMLTYESRVYLCISYTIFINIGISLSLYIYMYIERQAFYL